MDFKVEEHGDTWIIHMPRGLTVGNCGEYRRAVNGLPLHSVKVLKHDFSRTSLIDSSGFSALRSVFEQMERIGRRVKYDEMGEELIRIFEILRKESFLRSEGVVEPRAE